ncbi:MAG: hypothetical protein OXI24_07265, partial [Candidatus Poribacteria bacterium]|nr:hypothetical protein [Candidatus Poribacteria bacterium]
MKYCKDNGQSSSDLTGEKNRAFVKKIGVDTGGTFTDIVMQTNDSLFTHKVLSTPQNPADAVIE